MPLFDGTKAKPAGGDAAANAEQDKALRKKQVKRPGSGQRTFDENKHKRGAVGSGQGGRFVASGDSGDETKQVQKAVGAAEDGQFGPQTEQAVRDYQARHGLVVDGVVGHQTAMAIGGDMKGAQKAAPGELENGDLGGTGFKKGRKVPAKKDEGDPKWNWRTDGNGKRGVVLKTGARRIVNAQEFDKLQREGRLHPRNEKLVGDNMSSKKKQNLSIATFAREVARKRKLASLNLGFGNIVFNALLHPRDLNGRWRDVPDFDKASPTGVGDRFSKLDPKLPTDTQDLHTEKGPDGKWEYTAERTAKHRQWIDSFLQGKTPVENPMATWTAGGTASGKSSVVDPDNPSASGPVPLDPNTVIVDPDKFKALLPEYQAMVAQGDPRAAVLAHEESSDLAKALTAEAKRRGLNILVDGTGNSEPGKFAKKIKALSDTHQTRVVYVSVPTDTALEREHGRSLRTGRKVKEDLVRNMHVNVSANYPEVQKMAEEGVIQDLQVFDNQGEVGAPPTLVAQVKDGSLEIKDQAKYDAFLAKSGESKKATGAHLKGKEGAPADPVSATDGVKLTDAQKQEVTFAAGKAGVVDANVAAELESGTLSEDTRKSVEQGIRSLIEQTGQPGRYQNALDAVRTANDPKGGWEINHPKKVEGGKPGNEKPGMSPSPPPEDAPDPLQRVKDALTKQDSFNDQAVEEALQDLEKGRATPEQEKLVNDFNQANKEHRDARKALDDAQAHTRPGPTEKKGASQAHAVENELDGFFEERITGDNGNGDAYGTPEGGGSEYGSDPLTIDAGIGVDTGAFQSEIDDMLDLPNGESAEVDYGTGGPGSVDVTFPDGSKYTYEPGGESKITQPKVKEPTPLPEREQFKAHSAAQQDAVQAQLDDGKTFTAQNPDGSVDVTDAEARVTKISPSGKVEQQGPGAPPKPDAGAEDIKLMKALQGGEANVPEAGKTADLPEGWGAEGIPNTLAPSGSVIKAKGNVAVIVYPDSALHQGFGDGGQIAIVHKQPSPDGAPVWKTSQLLDASGKPVVNKTSGQPTKPVNKKAQAAVDAVTTGKAKALLEEAIAIKATHKKATADAKDAEKTAKSQKLDTRTPLDISRFEAAIDAARRRRR